MDIRFELQTTRKTSHVIDDTRDFYLTHPTDNLAVIAKKSRFGIQIMFYIRKYYYDVSQFYINGFRQKDVTL